MSDTAVEFPLNMVNKLLVYHPHLLGDAKKKMKTLQRDLRLLNAFLKRTVDERRKDERTKEMCIDIHDVVYELEDLLDLFVCQAIHKKPIKSKIDLHKICSKVEAVRDEVERYWIHTGILGIDHDKFEVFNLAPMARQKQMVGFVDVAEELISRLTQETDYLDVVSLIGMPGTGKTTLARNIFNHPKIVYNFPTRIWLISQELSDKDMLLTILREFTAIDEHLRRKPIRVLADMVAAYLHNRSFFIVFQNVWERTNWESLRLAMPKHNTRGKIIITTRVHEIGEHASRPRPPRRMPFLTDEESWELLRLEALGKLDCPAELKNVGKLIARGCLGRPFDIVVTGGILAAKFSPFGMIATRKAWEQVSTQVSEYLIPTRDLYGGWKFVFESYNKLPNHLRSCFLYLGMFPEDYDIPVSKLIRMWIAEGFVQENYDYSLEQTARVYLDELSTRNFVSIEKFKPDGQPETCRTSLRGFCFQEARNENFFQQLGYNEGGECNFSYSAIATYRRISVHSKCFMFSSSRKHSPCARTFVTISKNKYYDTWKDSSNIIQAFKLLRVLEVLPFQFTQVDPSLYNLVHLRYLALSSTWSILPSKFNNLWNLQTLILRTTSPTLEVKADIWQMNHLRHFKTNATATLPKPSRGSKHGVELQTLATISAESCTAELCHRAPNLKKLGIRGKLALLFEGKIGSFDSLANMEQLEKLKLVNEEGRPCCLPRYDQFPSGLKSLTLCSTFLSWDHISTLGLLEKLEVLKLKDNAFIGDTWHAENGGFDSLEYLHIEATDLAFWKASRYNYPKLRSLVLKDCEKLREIPIELADIPSLRALELYDCISAAKSARNISDVKKKTSPQVSEFKLSIYPSIE